MGAAYVLGVCAPTRAESARRGWSTPHGSSSSTALIRTSATCGTACPLPSRRSPARSARASSDPLASPAIPTRSLSHGFSSKPARTRDRQALYNRMFGGDDDHLVLLFEFGLGSDDGDPWRGSARRRDRSTGAAARALAMGRDARSTGARPLAARPWSRSRHEVLRRSQRNRSGCDERTPRDHRLAA